MMAKEIQELQGDQTGDRDPETVYGISGSPGIVVGRVVVLRPRADDLVRYHLEKDVLEEEQKRFQQAVDQAEQELKDLRSKFDGDLSDTLTIIDSHIRMLRDPMIVGQTARLIEQQQINAEWALSRSLYLIKKKFDHIADEYIRDRFADVEYVTKLLWEQLSEHGQQFPTGFAEPVIVVSEDFTPADTVRMQSEKVLGFLTEKGGTTSHTAIVARSLGLPAVVGVENITQQCRTGDTIILDGYDGRVCLAPTIDQQHLYQEYDRQHQAFSKELHWYINLSSETLDGLQVRLSANIEIPKEIKQVTYYGADGIGLFRSEFGYFQQRHLPDEETLLGVYQDLVVALTPQPVTIRTLDAGGDKLASQLPGHRFKNLHERNPALGLRSIRLSLSEQPLFITQIRALLRASAFGKLRILLPLISILGELHQVQEIIGQVMLDLTNQGIPFDPAVEVGIMVEVPSAVVMADALAAEVDFFSIGTNDLIQYSLAIDRGNEYVAKMYDPLHPAILRMISQTVKAGHDQGIEVALCGEMAGDVFMAPVLLGLGLDELSMRPSAIPHVKRLLRHSTSRRLNGLAKEILKCSDGKETRALLEKYIAKNYGLQQLIK
ncbi:MAG: phosphoenolpyruvate--protein phosphotransferase [Candidatus Electrothrix gigas]